MSKALRSDTVFFSSAQMAIMTLCEKVISHVVLRSVNSDVDSLTMRSVRYKFDEGVSLFFFQLRDNYSMPRQSPFPCM